MPVHPNGPITIRFGRGKIIACPTRCSPCRNDSPLARPLIVNAGAAPAMRSSPGSIKYCHWCINVNCLPVDQPRLHKVPLENNVDRQERLIGLYEPNALSDLYHVLSLIIPSHSVHYSPFFLFHHGSILDPIQTPLN